MKTTLDIPDSLLTQIKLQAVREGKKLKQLVAELLERGMKTGSEASLKRPVPFKLRGGFLPTTEDIESAIAEGRK